MNLIKILKEEDIPKKYVDTPIGELIRYHNFNMPFKEYDTAQILVGMCMDNRNQLNMPPNFAYIIRTGGGNLRYSEFKVSYAIAIGRIKYIVLFGHNNCGMVNLVSKREDFVNGLCELAGWTRERAEEHFMNFATMYEVDNEIDFVVNESERINAKYPGIEVVPLFYNIDDNLIYFIQY
ncbi:carbonic anhydrase [Desulfonispora thiosulfatigenes DSM 11270]|uniref:Carbonic anhydrase n=2 Tax=Desulfonispora thiosulfatigenes TaxID=83661 RepID=A0A1W1UJ87_DESTI|nr:carbonic anhydrase [Desulfonispora thiosulfatigenes DSM 11270]